MAATNPQPAVRVAAAAATSQLAPPEASHVLAILLEDADAGVRKTLRCSIGAGWGAGATSTSGCSGDARDVVEGAAARKFP
jgi:hypothetical protein